MSELVIVIVLFILSGFFSGSETALTALSTARADMLYGEKRFGSKSLKWLKSHPNRMLITILVGNNFVNIGASVYATVLATEHFGAIGPGIVTGVLTIFLLTFCEVTPKTLAVSYATNVSLFAAPIIRFLSRAMFPLIICFEYLARGMRSMGPETTEAIVTENEIVTMVGHGAAAGTIDENEEEMIRRVFEFDSLHAEDIMVPRHKVFSMKGDQLIKDVVSLVLEQGYARIPLHDDNPDVVNRVLHIKDFIHQITKDDINKTLYQIAREPIFIPVNQPLDELIHTLRRQKQKLVIVVDEFGTMQGVLTLEDIIEELVGEIYDDRDVPVMSQLRELPDGDLLIEGVAEIRLLEEYFGIELGGKPTDSVNLWILNHHAHIPEVGEQFEIDGLNVRVEKADRRQITQLRVKISN